MPLITAFQIGAITQESADGRFNQTDHHVISLMPWLRIIAL